MKSVIEEVLLWLFDCSCAIINTCPSTGPPANQVTHQELMRRYNLTDEQLNRKIRSSDCSYLAIYFDDVEIYSNVMELASAEQADVKRLYHSEGTRAAMMKCLKIWKEHNNLFFSSNLQSSIGYYTEFGERRHS